MADLEDRLKDEVRDVLHELLERRGWTVAALARATGIARNDLNNWRVGAIHNPRYLGLAKLFRRAGRSLDLCGGAPPLDVPATPDQLRTILAEELAAATRH